MEGADDPFLVAPIEPLYGTPQEVVFHLQDQCSRNDYTQDILSWTCISVLY